jgi:DNA topoisomerase-1
MEENLVIVESPAKAKTIEKFLGNGFTVKSSFGHIRDLDKKNLGIQVQDNFRPQYIIPEDKKKLVSELKKASRDAATIWLASDEDREGEAIAWHLAEVLGLKPENTRRIVFNEITREAILHAIEHPRTLDQNLVNAQQARRILDRLVGFELSPVLWKKVKPALSAGRVQSVAVRLLVEREREILDFVSQSAFRVTGRFHIQDPSRTGILKAELDKRFAHEDQALRFLEHCLQATFTLSDLSTKPSRKSPAPPFTTSTLQQEASRKLGFPVAQTMSVAQRLYEAGKITYMRTDSVHLSETALHMARQVITQSFGDKYAQTRQFKTRSKGAQEAHEAIRPTHMEKAEISGTAAEKRLYELIWKRTVASQMSDALLEKTTAIIEVSAAPEKFVSTGEVIRFDGFLKLYIESSDEENEEENGNLLPPLVIGEQLLGEQITAVQRFTLHPPRYSEASLVKKLEELGIGRPSTYAPTISTIQQRGYVVKEDRPGTERSFVVLTLQQERIAREARSETSGSEKAKLFPTDIGFIVNDFLVAHFRDILDYHFTASVEKQFDEIAEGSLPWTRMLQEFYHPFHNKVEETMLHSERTVGERILGTDPETGKPVIVKVGRYGPLVQLGETSDSEKPRFAGLLKGQLIETITLREALDLFRLPRKVGIFEGKEISAAIGRFGPYLKHQSQFYSLRPEQDNPMTINEERAIQLILEKREADKNKVIKTFEEDPSVQILNGRWGPYIKQKKSNFKIPKKTDAATLSYQDCLKIIASGEKKSPRTSRKKS